MLNASEIEIVFPIYMDVLSFEFISEDRYSIFLFFFFSNNTNNTNFNTLYNNH